MTKKIYIKLILPLFLCLFNLDISAQSIWDGEGGDAAWDNPMNWSDDVVPPVGALVEIGEDVTIIGTATNAPGQIKINGQSTVTLALDLTVGDGTVEEHAITVGKKCTLNFGEAGTTYNFDFNTPDNKQGIANFGSSDSAAIVIMKDATLSFSGHQTGINIVGPNSDFTNNGSINIAASVNDGFKSFGSITNNGSITIQDVNKRGIQSSGSFTNGTDGVINIQKAGDDGIEVLAGQFSNEGEISITVVDDAGSNNNGIVIGSMDNDASFSNLLSGELEVDGGPSDVARPIQIIENGTFSNSGSTTIFGGNVGSRLYSINLVLNDINGTIDLMDGRVNIKEGSIINNGLIKTTRDGSGILISDIAIATNNAFYKYDSSNTFAVGMGTVVDNGFSLNQFDRAKIDAEGSCTVDIAEASYEWFIDGTAIATSSADGSFTFPANSILEDSVNMTTTLADVKIRVINVCQEAVMSTGTDETIGAIDFFQIYPTLIRNESVVKIKYNEAIVNTSQILLFNYQGQQLKQIDNSQNTANELNVAFLPAGTYYVSLAQEGKLYTQRFIKL